MNHTKYHIVNRDYFLQTVQSFHTPFTAKDIADRLKENENPMGTSTIYRFLDEFSADGILRKSLGENNTVNYYYLKPCSSENHLYLECTNCHELKHLDCKHLHNFSKHLAKKHSFEVSNYALIIDGLCENCQGVQK